MLFLILLEMKLEGSANVQEFVGIYMWRYVEMKQRNPAKRFCTRPAQTTPPQYNDAFVFGFMAHGFRVPHLLRFLPW